MFPIDRSRIAIVLVRARNPNNIGAVARAMYDFGFTDLRLAGEYPVPLEAARSAVDASQVLRQASLHTELAAAIADCTLVLGTTAVGERVLEHPLETLAAAGTRLQAHLDTAPGHRVALLFGSEKTGLSNQELSHCHALLTIPMQQHDGVRHPSMNLGQAAAVCLYELVRSPAPLLPVAAAPPAVRTEELERLRALWSEVLELSGYSRRHPAHSDEAQVRRLVLRVAPSHSDTPVWMGVLRSLLWRMQRGPAAPEAPTPPEASRPSPNFLPAPAPDTVPAPQPPAQQTAGRDLK